MKTIACIISIILLSSCKKTVCYDYETNYQIRNELNSPVKLVTFIWHFRDTIILNKGDHYSNEEFEAGNPLNQFDSVELIFDNNKRKFDVSCSAYLLDHPDMPCPFDSITLFDTQNYEYTQVSEYKTKAIYKISMKDSLEAN